MTYTAAPSESADYKVVFTYKNQRVTLPPNDGTMRLTVLPQISVNYTVLPICEGDTTTLQLTTVIPGNVTLDWTADNTLDETGDPRIVMVYPPKTKAYKVTASLHGMCHTDFTPTVKVDEALRGEIKTNAPVCEGVNVRIDASSYKAAIHEWTSTAFTGIKKEAVLNELPSKTSKYFVTLTRGVCVEKDSITIEIASRPRIASIDSIGPRSRKIKMTPGYGTEPFLYGVDNRPIDSDPEKHNLAFSLHRFYAEDAEGCRSEMTDYMVDYPRIFTPPFFSPNGDGINDRWEIEGMAEIYPDAVIVIYDRYGKKLIEYKGSSSGWDGTYQGKEMPSTDYWYEIRIDEIKKQYVGHFTLVRAK